MVGSLESVVFLIEFLSLSNFVNVYSIVSPQFNYNTIND